MKKMRYLLIVGLILLDQVAKYAVRLNMEVGDSIKLIPDVFKLTYVQNTGAAFNLFEGMSVFLTVLPLAALAVGIWYMEKHLNEHWTLLLSLILIISGGVGNLVDRFWMGFVTDMFNFCLIDFPVFNVADIGICVGCFFLVIYIFFFDHRDETGSKQNED